MNIKIETLIIVQWLDEERIAPLSTSEKAFFYFIRNVAFDPEVFGVILKEHFPHLWDRLLGEAMKYERKSRE